MLKIDVKFLDVTCSDYKLYLYLHGPDNHEFVGKLYEVS